MARSDEGRAATAERGRSTTRRDLVEGQIIQEATRLFAERGFSGTSLKDIADATGLTRPALYYYVKSKDEILARLVTELAELPAQMLQALHEEKGMSATERLRRMAHAVAFLQASGPSRFQLLIRSEADVPDELVERYAKSRRRVLREFIGAVEEGIASGEFRAVDARIAALSVLGQCNWVAFWQPDDATAEENARVADAIADLAVASVQAGDDVTGTDVRRRSIARMRRELDYLEQGLDA